VLYAFALLTGNCGAKWLKRVDHQPSGSDDGPVIVFDGERFVVVADPDAGSSSGGGGTRLRSATVARKDGTYVNKLTVVTVVDGDDGQYVCLSTNNAGYSYRTVHLCIVPRELSAGFTYVYSQTGLF